MVSWVYSQQLNSTILCQDVSECVKHDHDDGHKMKPVCEREVLGTFLKHNMQAVDLVECELPRCFQQPEDGYIGEDKTWRDREVSQTV